jgi:hypothetical protein
MNSEKVQTIITEIISEFHSRIGGKAARKQAPVAKHQIKTLTELGILELMPKGFGHGDARVVIEAAQDAGGKQIGGFNAYGEGDVTTSHASALYQAINEIEPQPEFVFGELITRSDYLKALAEEGINYLFDFSTFANKEYAIYHYQESVYHNLIREFSGHSPRAIVWEGKKDIYYQHRGNLKLMGEVTDTIDTIRRREKHAGRELSATEIAEIEARERAWIEYSKTEEYFAKEREAYLKNHNSGQPFVRQSFIK